MNVRIFKPSKNAMQSGRASVSRGWVLEYETNTPKQAEPLIGWVSGDTLNQVRLRFDTCEEAIAFADKKGWPYTLLAEHKRRVKPRNYSDNFKYIPAE